jgi:hypothetical protein
VRELSVAEQRCQAVLLSTHPVPASSRGQYGAYADDAVRARSRGGYCTSRLEVGYQELARAGLPVVSSGPLSWVQSPCLAAPVRERMIP